MRQFLVALVVLLALYLALSQFTQLEHIWNILTRGNPLWLLLAGGVQLAWLVNTTLTYRAIYRLLGLKRSLRQLLPIVATSNFVNVVAPSGGLSGMALFIADARRNNLSPARVTIAGVLFVLAEYVSLLVVLALGLTVLFRRHNLNVATVSASAVLLMGAVALASLLFLGVYSAQTLAQVLASATRLVNALLRPILQRDYLPETRALTFATEAAEGLRALATSWREYLPPAALALLNKALLIAIFFLTFLAFEQPFNPGTLIAGFSIGYLFVIVSPTPSGIGFVEGAMTLTLRTLGVPLEAATVITLAYRGLTFWLPFSYGFIALRVTERQWTKKD